MKQLKAFKYRLQPTKEQELFLVQNIGCARFIWNKLVEHFNSWGKDKPQQRFDLTALKKSEEYNFLNSAISYVLQQKCRDFETYKSQFFNKKRKVRIGRAKFKKKGVGRETFRIPAASMHLENFSGLNGGLKLPKLDSRIKMKIDREFTGRPVSVTISKNPSGQWFVSILTEEEISILPQTGKSIGIDLGLSDLMICSTGLKISNPKFFRKNQTKLKKLQQRFARKKKGSNRREKLRLKIAKLYQKITDKRTWLYHNLSSYLVRNFDIISMETLKVKNMLKNRKLSKAISEASWSSFVSMVDYKCKWYGKTFHQINTWHPSSKLCSECGYKMDDMDLSIREWTCPECQTSHDRDINAAINILNKGLTDLYGLTSDELADYRRGGEIRRVDVSSTAHLMKRLSETI